MPAPTSSNFPRQRDEGWEFKTVVLEKANSKQSFGIAISGGTDNPHFQTNDPSILITDIAKGSPADGNLRVGDVLISVNERVVDGGPHQNAVNALKAAGMQARMEIKRAAPKPKGRATDRIEQLQDTENGTPKGSPRDGDSDRGRSRKKPREMEQESAEKSKRSRSRSKHKEDGEDGEKSSRRSRSRDRKDGEEGGERKERRSRSRNREDGENGEKKERRSRSRNREDGEGGEKKERRSRSRNREEGEDGEKRERRSRSRHREDGEDGEKKERRSRSRHREDGEDGEKKERRSRSKSRSRDDLTRSKSKESLHRSKSKSKDNLDSPKEDFHTIVLNRSDKGYGFSLQQQIVIQNLAPDSVAANEGLVKGDIVYEINGTNIQKSTLEECYNIVRAATEQVTLKIVRPKPTQASDQTDNKPKPSKPSRPVEAAEVDITPKVEREVREAPKSEKPKPPKEEPRHERRPRSEEESELDSPIEKEPVSPNDSWAAASPQKQSYPSSTAAHPNQEVENMDAKLERLKAGRKFERRLSEMPDARVISFHKTGSVGIQVAGGNSLGIFVAAIRPDSAAAKEGLKPGDQIIMCNEIDFEDITREEAVLILLALPDDVSLIVESKKAAFEQIKKELGDNFFIRANFDHIEKANPNELTFRKGEIFNVRDTMYQGLIGYWQAQRVGKNGKMLERGVLPNKSRAEQLALAQKMEERQASTPGRSKVKRKGSIGGTLKKHKFVSQDKLDESSFAEGVQVPAYERVVLKVADFMRPVVVLGALGDLIRLKLLEEMPDRFDLPTPTDLGGRNASNEPYGQSINLSEIRNVIAKNKHCLLDITPEGIEMLMYAQLCPIVVLLKSPSRGAVRDMRQSLVSELRSSPTGVPGFEGDPLNAKQLKRVFANAKKLEEFYPHIFTAKINTHIAGGDKLSREFFYKLKEIIFNQQAQSAWMPEEKPDEMLDDMVFHPPNYQSMYMSGLDSDTEGESTTSSPVLARKHYEEEEDSPLPSPVEPPKEKLPETVEPPKRRERSKDRRDRDESSDREHRRSRHHKSKERRKKEERTESPEPAEETIVNAVVESQQQQLPDIDLNVSYDQSYKSSPKQEKSRDYEPDYRSSPKHRDTSRDYEQDYRSPPKPRDDDNDYYRPPPPRENGYKEPPRNDYRDRYEPPNEPPKRGGYQDDYYRDPPVVNREIKKTVDQHLRGRDDEEEDIPALRDPKFGSPQVFPDSPPSRRPPEVKAKPATNAVKVFPNENKFSMEEKRRSLRKVPDRDEEEEEAPPPPPPPSSDSLPTKSMTLQERMSKFQQKVTTHSPSRPVPPSVPVNEEPPPPARPSAPRNYVIDARNRNAPRSEIYSQNAYKPKPQFAEVTHVSSRNKVEEPYVNVRHDKPVESAPTSRYPGYDYVKPFSSAPDYNSTNYAHNYKRTDTNGYSVPSSYDSIAKNYRGSHETDDYPAYHLPDSKKGKTNDLTRNSYGEEEPRVIATARGTFDHRGGLLESQETNVSIYIPAGALPEGRKQEVYFKVCQDSKYMPPLDSNSGETLLSPLVMCGPHGLKFRKPIELRLPHRGASNDSMAFSLKSSDSPVGHPAQWRNVKLGGKDLDSGRAYQVTDDTVSVLVDHF